MLQNKQEIRFAVSNVRKGVDHIQVQYKEDGIWKYSSQSKDWIFDGKKHFEPYKYLTWKELLDELR